MIIMVVILVLLVIVTAVKMGWMIRMVRWKWLHNTNTQHTLPRWEHPGPLLFQSICEHSPIWPGNGYHKDIDDGDDHDDYHYDQDSDGDREWGRNDADRDVPKNGQRGMDRGCC